MKDDKKTPECPPRSARLRVGAYVPAGETYPVLVPLVERPGGQSPLFIGVVVRRGEFSYAALLQACNQQPVWLLGCAPQPLS